LLVTYGQNPYIELSLFAGIVGGFFAPQAGLLDIMKFSELVRLLEQNGFLLVKEKGSIRYYAKAGHQRLIRIDFHGAKEVPTGTCHAIMKAAGLRNGEEQ
jgi:predicted RNA binding protein YcfA (HicA-like mRNA interferase family)